MPLPLMKYLAATYNFEVNEGATWYEPITIEDDGGEALDLSGCTARMHIRDAWGAGGDLLLELTTANDRIVVSDTAPNLVITVNATTMATLTRSGVYDIELVDVNDFKILAMRGDLKVTNRVTQD